MKAAFFDIDGTIYRDSLLQEHFKKLIKYEVFTTKEYENRVKESFIKWDERLGDYDLYLMGMAKTYVTAIKGLDTKYNDFVADQVLALKGNRVYAYTRDRIKWHKEQGHKVIFISGSPDFLVSRMAEKWKADNFAGSIYHVEDGKFSGVVSPMWDSVNKIKSINQFAEEYDLNLSECYAYGDTMGDLSMMTVVGYPTAFNPSSELVEELRNNIHLKDKINIIIERKDVIYKVKTSVEVL